LRNFRLGGKFLIINSYPLDKFWYTG